MKVKSESEVVSRVRLLAIADQVVSLVDQAFLHANEKSLVGLSRGVVGSYLCVEGLILTVGKE